VRRRNYMTALLSNTIARGEHFAQWLDHELPHRRRWLSPPRPGATAPSGIIIAPHARNLPPVYTNHASGELTRHDINNVLDRNCRLQCATTNARAIPTLNRALQHRAGSQRHLQAQDDAASKGQTGRQKVYDGLLERLDNTGT